LKYPDFVPSGKIPNGMIQIGVFLENITSRQAKPSLRG
jgi:hypothetical protein